MIGVLIVRSILGQVKKAVKDYDMILEGDRIAVGVSGGKDSLSLLIALSKLKNYYPVKFTIEAVTIDMGFEGMDFSCVESLCRDLGISYTIEKTHIAEIVFDKRQEKSPCSLCANLRRGALNKVALRLQCNKVALAHHRNDVIETLLMNMFYEGRIHTFSPVTYLSRSNLHVIRPLVFLDEKDIESFIVRKGINTVKNSCTADGNTKRQKIKDLLNTMSKDIKDIHSSIFGAIKRSTLDDWQTDISI